MVAVSPSKPRTVQAQLARGDIARAAVDVFARRGVDETRVEDLLAAAGVARRTFYKHFRNKEDVLVALYDLVTRELAESVETATDHTDDPWSAVHAVLDGYLAYHVTNHAIVRVLVEEATRSSSPLWTLRRRFRTRLVRALDAACSQVTGQCLDPFVFLALVSGLEGLSLEILQTPPTEREVARVRAAMLGLLMATLGAASALPRASE